jgi:hypothetical protein
MVAGGRFRTVELKQLRGWSLSSRRRSSKRLPSATTSHIAIDGQGVGEAVWQIVKTGSRRLFATR